jgi:hypothetical protein
VRVRQAIFEAAFVNDDLDATYLQLKQCAPPLPPHLPLRPLAPTAGAVYSAQCATPPPWRPVWRSGRIHCATSPGRRLGAADPFK